MSSPLSPTDAARQRLGTAVVLDQAMRLAVQNFEAGMLANALRWPESCMGLATISQLQVGLCRVLLTAFSYSEIRPFLSISPRCFLGCSRLSAGRLLVWGRGIFPGTVAGGIGIDPGVENRETARLLSASRLTATALAFFNNVPTERGGAPHTRQGADQGDRGDRRPAGGSEGHSPPEPDPPDASRRCSSSA